jgi:hypothetical protein
LVRYASIAVFAVLVSVAAPSATAQAKEVAFHLNSESWVKDSSFPIAEFRKQCTAAGVKLGDKGKLDVTIDYEESKGSGYSMFGIGTPSAWGTNISYEITILSEDGSETLIKRKTTASTDSSDVSSSGLHASARRNFLKEKTFTESCSMIAALLDSHAEQAKLLPWAVFSAEGRALLERVGFAPKTDTEKAYMAIAQRRFEEIPALGKAAIAPMVHYLRRFHDYELPWDLRTDDKPEVAAQAITAYAQLKDAKFNEIMGKLFTDLRGFYGPSEKIVATAMLEAARDNGGRSLLKPLAVWRDAAAKDKVLADLLPLAEEARAAIVARN